MLGNQSFETKGLQYSNGTQPNVRYWVWKVAGFVKKSVLDHGKRKTEGQGE